MEGVELFGSISASVLEQNLFATRMVSKEASDIVDTIMNDDPAILQTKKEWVCFSGPKPDAFTSRRQQYA